MMNKKLVLIYTIILLLLLFFIKNCEGYKLVSDKIKIENYIKKHNRSLTNGQREMIAITIIEESSYYDNISFKVVLAIIKIESNFDPYAIGAAGERGLMQIYTLECFDLRANEALIFYIQYNIAFGICILNSKLISANNDIVKAIRLYNGSGPATKIYAKKVLNALNEINKEFD